MSNVVSDELLTQEKPKTGLIKQIFTVIVAMLPWAIIAGLLSAAIYIEPKAVGGTIDPPILENRDTFYGLAHFSDGTVLASGSYGKILSIKEGKVSLLETPTRNALQDIAVWDSKHAVAVGNDGVIVFSHDAGATWQEAVEVPRSDIANKLNRIRVGQNGFAIATGEMGAVLATYDFGKKWQRIREEEDSGWNDIAILADGQLVLVGEFGRILLGHIGSNEWEEIEVMEEISIMSVAFRDSLRGVAVGLDGLVLKTHDGGQSWNRESVGISDHLFSVVWRADKKQWLTTGALGRWATSSEAGWVNGVLDNRNLSWHVSSLPMGDIVWMAGANLGTWDGESWSQLRL